jgi:heavy metal translocating P-type ATPase
MKYPTIVATLVVAVVAGVLSFALPGEAARWVVSIFALAIAARESVEMVRSMLRGHFGIDVLAVTAIIATVLVGEFWASLIIVLMFTGGEALEDYAQGRAKRELSALLERNPLVAHRELDGTSVDVPVGEVLVGDILVVKPGELVPVDGELLSDHVVLDESSLTGESLPVERAAGDQVVSGAVNGPVAARIGVTAVASDSQYQRIVALVAEASESRAPFVRMADRYAVPFTIGAYLLAVAGWVASGDPARFAEVLVVATPCPLIIAAPVAFIAGMSRAARHGIIVKNGGTLEKLSRVRTVAFDKTGTLTHGRPALVAVRAEAGVAELDLLAAAASAEQYSAHTLAQSIVAGARERGAQLATAEAVQETTAAGLEASVDGRRVVVGKLRFVSEQVSGAHPAPIEAGELAVYVGVDGVFAGALVLRDEQRDDAAQTLHELARLGVGHTLMLTGDARATAEHVAATLGLTEVFAECLPLDKVRAVEAVTDRPVMMVGDGVNDAPVLAAADVGVAMGARGATAASESADVVIMKDDLARVARAIEIGQQTIRIASQSIWIGIVLSVGLMIAAVFGLIPAVVGAGFQEVIDVLTIVNALRALGRVRPARSTG